MNLGELPFEPSSSKKVPKALTFLKITITIKINKKLIITLLYNYTIELIFRGVQRW